MKAIVLFIFLLLLGTSLFAQKDYPTPPEGLIPPELASLPRQIEVIHFPETSDPIKIKELYYWKHLTSILAKNSEIIMVEYGAYIYYNNTWNLRQSYDLAELDKTFGTKNQKLLQAQPYTWNDNWRVGDALFGGWALWYFVGKKPDGELVCGYQKINTTSSLINSKI